MEHSTTLAQNPFDDKFEKRVKWILDHFHVPGLSMAVVAGNDTFLKVPFSFSHTFQSTGGVDSDATILLNLGLRSL